MLHLRDCGCGLLTHQGHARRVTAACCPACNMLGGRCMSCHKALRSCRTPPPELEVATSSARDQRSRAAAASGAHRAWRARQLQPAHSLPSRRAPRAGCQGDRAQGKCPLPMQHCHPSRDPAHPAHRRRRRRRWHPPDPGNAVRAVHGCEAAPVHPRPLRLQSMCTESMRQLQTVHDK